MKGLLKKDFLMIKSYCKIYFAFVAILFFTLAFSSDYYIVSFLFLIPSMIVIVLMSYDERNGWDTYWRYLPVNIKQVVSCKYLIGLIIVTIIVVCSSLIVGIRDIEMLKNEILGFIIIPLVSLSLITPFYFRLGVQKARIAYYVAFGATSALLTQASSFNLNNVYISDLIIVIFIFMLFGLSWLLSIKLYERRLSKLR